jgi:hypothetical protein
MRRDMRRGAFVVLAAGFAVLPAAFSTVSCSHGGYDGTFDSSGLEILAAQATQGDARAGPPVTQGVSANATGTTAVATHDGVFEIDVPAHAFPSDVTITVTPLADRTLANQFIVPSYAVTVTPPVAPKLPIQIQFRGNNIGNGGNQSILAPVALGADGGGTSPFGVVGGNVNTGGPTGQLWAVVSTLGGSYSLDYVPNPSSQTFLQPTNTSCLATCCNANHNGGAANSQVYATDVGCACANVSANLDCFVAHCPDPTLLANECIGLRTTASGELGCVNGQPCNALNNVCCYQPNGQPQNNLICSGPGNNGCNYAAHCTDDSQCGGSICCAFDGEALCAPSCPPERHVCGPLNAMDAGACGSANQGASADSGAQCAKAGKCPFAVCGAPPDVCR